MPTNNWLPRAAAVTEVKSGSINAYDAATTYTLTRNGKAVTSLAAGSAALAAAALVAAWEASAEVELTEITATNPSGSTIMLTMDTPGVPSGPITLTATGGTGSVVAISTTTAATSSQHVDNILNWSLGALPTTDDVQVDLGRGSMLYGLDQLTGTGMSLYVYASGRTSNTIGLPEVNEAGYVEDRPKRLLKSFTTVRLDCESSLIRLDVAAVTATIEVRVTGDSGVDGQPAVLLAGTSASNVFEVLAGEVGLAYYADEAVAGSVLRVGDNGSVVQGKNGGLITTVTTRGTVELHSTVTTLNQSAGSVVIEGSATPTIVMTGGTCDYAAGNPTAITVGNGGNIRFNEDLTPITAGSVTLNKGGSFYDPARRVTITSLLRGSDVESLSAS